MGNAKKNESTGFDHQLHIRMQGQKEFGVPLGFLFQGIQKKLKEEGVRFSFGYSIFKESVGYLGIDIRGGGFQQINST